MSDKVGGSLFYSEDINMDPMQNYFGEKIGLYFVYLQNFAIKLKWLGLFGVLMFIADQIMLKLGNEILYEQESKKEEKSYNIYIELYHYNRLFFTLILVIWTTLFTEF